VLIEGEPAIATAHHPLLHHGVPDVMMSDDGFDELRWLLARDI
jgi:hypothetical protein